MTLHLLKFILRFVFNEATPIFKFLLKLRNQRRVIDITEIIKMAKAGHKWKAELELVVPNEGVEKTQKSRRKWQSTAKSPVTTKGKQTK